MKASELRDLISDIPDDADVRIVLNVGDEGVSDGEVLDIADVGYSAAATAHVIYAEPQPA